MRFRAQTWLAVVRFLLVSQRGAAVYLVGRPSTQASTATESTPAYKAVDGEPESCATTESSEHPWWRVDMVEEYCVGTITVINGADCCAEDLIGATVRAGSNPSAVENTACGSPVTPEQAAASGGARLRFACHPPVLARYLAVDVDLRGAGRSRSLTVCEVEMEEAPASECADWGDTGFLDATCMTPTPLLDPGGDPGAFIGTYLGARDAAGGASVSFGRASSTGHPGAATGLPASAHQVHHPVGSTDADLLYLPVSGGAERLGAFYCQATAGQATTRITVILLGNTNVHIRPVVLTKTVNALESVRLEMEAVDPPAGRRDWRWRHDGSPFIQRSQDQLTHRIRSVCPRDAGVYECHVNTFRPLQLHGIMRLIVRECPAGRWGPDASCTNLCPPCYNGGVCDALNGRCVCAPGFKGRYCEEVLGRNYFGQDGSHYCQNPDDGNGCRGNLFCLPDPYGCSCAAGFKGFDCMTECHDGTYGADCKQTCHCALNVTCEKDTGKCQGDCALSYFGENCQQTDCPMGFFGAECSQTCHCQSGTCHHVTGECEGPCALPYFGVGCQQTGFDGVPDLMAYQSEASAGHVVLSWGADSAAFYTVGYELVNRGQCQPIASPGREFLARRLDKGASHAVLTNLEPSSLYRVYVQSHYGVHSVVPVETYVDVATSPANDSQLVKDFRAVDVSTTSIFLSWSPVQCADAYYLTFDLVQRGQCARSSDTPLERSTLVTLNTSADITSGEPFSTYRVAVAANVEGANGSATMLEVTTANAAPGAPGGLTEVPSAAANGLRFAWDDLPCEERGGPLEGYRYALRDADSGDTLASGAEVVAEVGFAGLPPCRRYEFRVAAQASSGVRGSYSRWLAARTAVRVPGPVNNLTVAETSANETTLSWQPPLLTTCGVSAYRVGYQLTMRDLCSLVPVTASPRRVPVPANSTSPSARLAGLVPASQYRAFVAAVNAAGESQEMSVLWTTNESAPTSPPEDVMVLASPADRSGLGFSWSRPPCGGRGGTITGYAYRLSHRADGPLVADTAGETAREWVVVAGLVPSREYGFRVAARTAAGLGPYSQTVRATVGPSGNGSDADRSSTPASGSGGDRVRPLPPAKAAGPVTGSDAGGAVAAVAVTGLLVAAVLVAAYVKLKRGRRSLVAFRFRRGLADEEPEMMTEMDSRGQ